MYKKSIYERKEGRSGIRTMLEWFERFVFDRYMKGMKALLEAELAAENEKVVRERVERELEEMKRLSEREREVRTHTNHIRECILTVHLPLSELWPSFC